MSREIEENEHQMTKILNHNDNANGSRQTRKDRPITSTQPNRAQKRLIVNHSQESNEDRNYKPKAYNNFMRNRSSNGDLDDNQNDNSTGYDNEADDLVGIMNNRNTSAATNQSKLPANALQKKNMYSNFMDQQSSTKNKTENQEIDYLDYQSNIDNLKKIADEQSKYDNLGGDLDSYFTGLNSLLGKKQSSNPTSSYQPSYVSDDIYKDDKPKNINEVVDIYKELGLPQLPDELPKLQSVNYKNVTPDYSSLYNNQNLENENPNINFGQLYSGFSKVDAFNPDIESILNPKLSQNSYNKNMLNEIPSWREPKPVTNNHFSSYENYDSYEEAPRSFPVSNQVPKTYANTNSQPKAFGVNYQSNDLIDSDLHEEQRMQAPVPYSINPVKSTVNYMHTQPGYIRAPEPSKNVVAPKPVCFADVLKSQPKPQTATTEGQSIYFKPVIPTNNVPSQVSQIT